MQLSFCSKCDHSEEYGTQKDMYGKTLRSVPKPEFCSKCGAQMLYACQNCGSERRSMSDKFCTKCGKPYKL